MPLPVAHSAAGLAGLVALGRGAATLPRSRQVLLGVLAVVAANLPDLDFLPGFLLGDPGRYHHGVSHSLMVGVLGAGLLFALARPWLAGLAPWRLALLLVLAVLSHPLLDFFSLDTSRPYGVPLFLPFFEGYQISPLSVFSDVQRSQSSNAAFVTSVFNRHNLLNAIAETLFGVGLLAAVLVAKGDAGAKRRTTLVALSAVATTLFLIVRWAQG